MSLPPPNRTMTLTTFDWGNWQHEFDPQKNHPSAENLSVDEYSTMPALDALRNQNPLGYSYACLDSGIGMSDSPATSRGDFTGSAQNPFFTTQTPTKVPAANNNRKRAATFDDDNVFSNTFSTLTSSTQTTSTPDDHYTTRRAKKQRTSFFNLQESTGFTPSPTFSDSGYASHQSSPSYSPIAPTTTTTTPLLSTTPSTPTSHTVSAAVLHHYKASVHASMKKTFYNKYLRSNFAYPAKARDQLAPTMAGAALDRLQDRPPVQKLILKLDFANKTIHGKIRIVHPTWASKGGRPCDTKMREAEGSDYLNPRGYGKPRFDVDKMKFVPRAANGRRR